MRLVKIGSVKGLLPNKFPIVTWTICWLNCQAFSRDIHKIPITMSSDFRHTIKSFTIVWRPQWVKDYMLSLRTLAVFTKHDYLAHSYLHLYNPVVPKRSVLWNSGWLYLGEITTPEMYVMYISVEISIKQFWFFYIESVCKFVNRFWKWIIPYILRQYRPSIPNDISRNVIGWVRDIDPSLSWSWISTTSVISANW